MTDAGVLAGATIPNQVPPLMPPRSIPLSVKVGTSGNVGTRSVPVTARARNFPEVTCGPDLLRPRNVILEARQSMERVTRRRATDKRVEVPAFHLRPRFAGSGGNLPRRGRAACGSDQIGNGGKPLSFLRSANGMVRPCSCPASDKLARGAKTRSTPWLRQHRVRLP